MQLLGQVQRPQGVAHGGQLVVLVVDHEVARQAGAPRPRGAGAARRGCGRWRSSSAARCPASSASARAFISPAALLVKVTARMASEGTPSLQDQVGDAVRDHARLAAARAGQDQHGPFGGQHGLALLGVQARRGRRRTRTRSQRAQRRMSTESSPGSRNGSWSLLDGDATWPGCGAGPRRGRRAPRCGRRGAAGAARSAAATRPRPRGGTSTMTSPAVRSRTWRTSVSPCAVTASTLPPRAFTSWMLESIFS